MTEDLKLEPHPSNYGDISCRTCRWFDGLCCKHNSPARNSEGNGRWPTVYHNDWCGKYTNREFYELLAKSSREQALATQNKKTAA